MTVSDVRFAGQLVAPGEEPRFFDDIGCLRAFLKGGATRKGETAYVADHRTKTWVVAAKAVYVRNDQVQTPMGSHLLAYVDAASRDADQDSRGTPMTAADVFGPDGPPHAVK
jgi:copper chaperone NosL